MKNKIFKSALLCLLLVFSGCGYTTRSAISNKYSTIYITPFVNKTDITSEFNTGSQYHIYRPHLETDVTTVVVNKFLFDGNLKPVKMNDADLILKGEVTDFRKDPLRYDDNQNVLEYRVSIVINMSMWDRKQNTQIWQETGFTGDTTYYVSGPSSISEAAAINNALTDITRRVVERAVEQW